MDITTNKPIIRTIGFDVPSNTTVESKYLGSEDYVSYSSSPKESTTHINETIVVPTEIEEREEVEKTTEVSTSDSTSNGETRKDRAMTEKRKRTVADFAFGKLLGEGSYAEVKLGTEIASGKEYAIKILDKQQIIKEKKIKYVNTEKAILDMLKHPNIVLLYYTFQDPERLYFVLELCPNGELLDLIRKAGRLNEECCKFYTAEIVSGLEYLHGKGIVHRDLKPENILLGPSMHAKLNDFGTAKDIGLDPRARSHSFTGTAEYVPPELLKEKSAGQPGDLWALGCIIYQMLVGQPPFQGETEWMTFQLVIENKPKFPLDFPSTAKDLILKLLVTNPDDRLGVKDGWKSVKSHPFFNGINWETLHLQTPPITAPMPLPKFETSTIERSPRHSLPVMRVKEELDETKRTISDPQLSYNADAERSKLLEQQKNSLWFRFLASGELIIHSGLIKKTKGLSTKKRQLILTDMPRIFYLDPEKMEQKGEIPWSSEIRVTLKDSRKFQIITPGRVYHLEDISSTADKWAAAITGVKMKQKQGVL